MMTAANSALTAAAGAFGTQAANEAARLVAPSQPGGRDAAQVQSLSQTVGSVLTSTVTSLDRTAVAFLLLGQETLAVTFETLVAFQDRIQAALAGGSAVYLLVGAVHFVTELIDAQSPAGLFRRFGRALLGNGAVTNAIRRFATRYFLPSGLAVVVARTLPDDATAAALAANLRRRAEENRARLYMP